VNVEKFLIEGGYSKATQETYRRFLDDLVSIPDLQNLDAVGLLNFFDRPQWGNSMRYVAVSASRSFLRWRYGSQHSALSARIKRRKAKRQRSLTAEQLSLLLVSFDTSTQKGARDLAIASLAVEARLRVSELARLKLSNIDLEAGTLQVVVKGGEWGDGVFSPTVANIISAYLARRKPKDGDDHLFLSVQKPHAGRGMKVTGIKALVRRWGERVGFKISPHDFCRTFAVLSTENGAPSRVVQKAGRWANIDMVVRYTENIEQEAIRPYLPVERLLG